MNLNGHDAETLNNIGDSAYASKSQQLIQLITELRSIGTESIFPLPQIAVIGNQSAGKSSLIEAISGITVPRAVDTCTRCPMECRLTYSPGPWQAQVLLRRVSQAKNEIPFGDLLTNTMDLEDRIHRAQIAILNPSFDPTSFVSGPDPANSELRFCSDIVCIDVRGPELTDLTFIDLPGLITNAGDGGDRSDIQIVRDMVEMYINGDALILLTVTMRDDINNQGAADLARQVDSEGERTIGVLTKADTIQGGEERRWIEVLKGNAHRLKHGYFITKRPSPMESQYPWNTLPDLQHRMGTPQLTKELSKLLANLIDQALPDLRQKARKALSDVKAQLDGLPPPLSEHHVAELLGLVTKFSGDVSNLVRGSESFESLVQLCRPAYAEFKDDILKTNPIFLLHDGIQTETLSEPESLVTTPDPIVPAPTPYEITGPSSMTLEDVREHIQKLMTRELPFNTPYRAKVTLIERFFAQWDILCRKCFDTIDRGVLQEIAQLVYKHFNQYRKSSLLDQVQSIVADLVDASRRTTQERIKWLLELENPPFTSNDHYYSAKRDNYLKEYRTQRLALERSWNSSNIQHAVQTLAGMGFRNITVDSFASLLSGGNQWEEEMIVMAETSAYFHVSYKRIIDNLPRVIDLDFLRSIQNEVQGALIKGLELDTEDATRKARMYLAEDPDISTKRIKLEQDKALLEKVMKNLFQFGQHA